MATSDLCPRCNTCSENITHLFRECNKAKELWSCIPSSHLMRGDMDTSNCEWISLNMRSNREVGIGNTPSVPICLSNLKNLTFLGNIMITSKKVQLSTFTLNFFKKVTLFH
ncbi:hypothetical protein RHGRI_006155 [Rhododendron griersonianum]|uniref:Reverse transcriptase zinc-binding domain-containing protein n=1 Tax=Rhododendron griersonianum TaxID=479676 RepID=A0AAV6LFZ3_9ERIC|nr:hypothetical protein RHGRI_006155 [Rhododendron griersonianum]